MQKEPPTASRVSAKEKKRGSRAGSEVIACQCSSRADWLSQQRAAFLCSSSPRSWSSMPMSRPRTSRCSRCTTPMSSPSSSKVSGRCFKPPPIATQHAAMLFLLCGLPAPFPQLTPSGSNKYLVDTQVEVDRHYGVQLPKGWGYV